MAQDTFFRKLGPCLEALPQPLVQRKLLPALAAGLEFGSAPAAALGPLLAASRALPAEQFKRVIVPCIVRLFSSTDRAMRVCLLQNLDSFVEHLAPDALDGTPQLSAFPCAPPLKRLAARTPCPHVPLLSAPTRPLAWLISGWADKPASP